MSIHPIAPRHEEPKGFGAPGDGPSAWRGRTEEVDEVYRYEKHDERPKPDGALAIARFRHPLVEPHGDGKEKQLDGQGRRQRIPQTKPKLPGITDRQRHIGPMGQDIQEPMTEHQPPDYQRNRNARPPKHQISQSKSGCPSQQRNQAMGVGIPDEIQRGDDGVARLDLDGLDSEKDQCWPEQIGKLARQEQRAERDLGSQSLGSKSECEVTDEHCWYLARVTMRAAPKKIIKDRKFSVSLTDEM